MSLDVRLIFSLDLAQIGDELHGLYRSVAIAVAKPSLQFEVLAGTQFFGRQISQVIFD